MSTPLETERARAQEQLGVTVAITEEKKLIGNTRVVIERVLRVTLPAGAPSLRARFVSQGWKELAKKVFVSEVEVGDASFDDAVYVTTDTPEPVRALLAHASAREALTSLVRRHAMIEVDATAATVTISDAFEDDGSEAAALLALVGCLRA